MGKSLASEHPDIANEWDHERNGNLRPETVAPKSNKIVHWKCQKFSHQWSTSVASRTNGSGCPICANRKLLSGFNDLQTRFPNIAAEWDYVKNFPLTPADVLPGSAKTAHWKCVKHGHEWSTKLVLRTRNNRGCPACVNQMIVPGFNDLQTAAPDLASEWDLGRNHGLQPDQVSPGSKKVVYWRCKAHGHQWEAQIKSRAKDGNGCPFCSGQRVLSGFNDLEYTFPEVAAEWDHSANGGISPSEVVAGSPKNAHWKCGNHGHRWIAAIRARTRKGRNCPYCANQKALEGFNDLKSHAPGVAREWDYMKNFPTTPEECTIGSKMEAHWICPNGHEYKMVVNWRTRAVNPLGCHCQGKIWSNRRLEGFVADLVNYTDAMTPAMLYAVCQQAGVLRSSKSDVIGKALSDLSNLKKLVGEREAVGDEERSLTPLSDEGSDPSSSVDDATLDVLDPMGHLPTSDDIAVATAISGADGGAVGKKSTAEPEAFPHLSVEEVLGVGEKFFASMDAEAVEFLTAAAAAQIWKLAYRLDSVVVSDTERRQLQAELDKTIEPCPDEYAERIRDRFRSEYEQAVALPTPVNWSFRPGGTPDVTAPNLMQRHVAAQVLSRKRVGNWSGPGAGKTVSAILAAGLLNAGCAEGLVLVICPNNVVSGWVSSIRDCNPEARVAAKTLTPSWDTGVGPRWLILNFDRLPGNEGCIRQLIGANRIDMLVIDEVHYVKERENVAPSHRRRVLAGIAVYASESNPDLAVLGLSATPVVNDLHEARSLLELVEGVRLDDLPTAKNVPNAMRIHQFLVRVGSRWMPDYAANLEPITIPIDITDRIDDVLALGKSPTPAALDQLLLADKLGTIVANCSRERKTLIYTQFVTDVTEPLVEALIGAGLRVGLFTGHDKSGYARFLGVRSNGDAIPAEEQIDVLIGSEAISTGVDGLQHVCDTLIFATLPWTHANFRQIVGRIHRQGQSANAVKVIIPTTFATVTSVEGEMKQWSWCGQRWARVEMKETLSDCAVDGVVPKGVLITPTQAAHASLEWLRRLKQLGPQSAVREPLDQLLGDDVDRLDSAAKFRRFSDLSKMNGAWAATNSAVTHSRLAGDSAEWRRYHDLYSQARQGWEVVPAYEFAEWLNQRRRPYVVADLGCGEMLLSDRVTAEHTILPFDHVAIDDRVTVCDIAEVPLDDASVDIAVLSLALMGRNHTDYIREANRILPVDGHMWLCEPSSSIGTDELRLRKILSDYGFDLYRLHVAGQFTFVRAIKSDRGLVGTPTPIKLPAR